MTGELTGEQLRDLNEQATSTMKCDQEMRWSVEADVLVRAGWRPPGWTVDSSTLATLREVTETHADAPVGELISEVRRLVDNDDHCTSEHYNPERDRKRAELHLGYPPADLPAIVASVDDVRQVCVAAGLTESADGRSWFDDRVNVRFVHGEIGWQVVRRDGCGGQLVCEASDWIPLPGRTLWDAIQAARSAL